MFTMKSKILQFNKSVKCNDAGTTRAEHNFA